MMAFENDHKKIYKKMANLKSLTPFLFFFALPFERIFIKMHSTESRRFTGLENILFAGMSMRLSAREF